MFERHITTLTHAIGRVLMSDWGLCSGLASQKDRQLTYYTNAKDGVSRLRIAHEMQQGLAGRLGISPRSPSEPPERSYRCISQHCSYATLSSPPPPSNP